MQKPSIPRGTRDFGPDQLLKRKYIFQTIERVYQQFGFLPIETPTMENLSTLTGKYGDEGDQLLFKVLNSGDFLKKVEADDIKEGAYKQLTSKVAEKGLRYDLTVPFARYVVMHRNDITFPFKRYQIQPVWRADRPQKGRYREFYQCDADIIGSDSLLNEVELVQILDTVFHQLNIRVDIRLNNRKILAGIAEIIGASDQMIPLTVAIDKLDKIGWEGVTQELEHLGFSSEQVTQLKTLLSTDSSEELLETLAEKLTNSDTGKLGVTELQSVFQYLNPLTISSKVSFDPTLARGLTYYTGAIFEVTALDTPMGSISGGGRYDNLTGIFGLKDVSGVGISFGADRIYDVMEALDLFPEQLTQATQVLLCCMDEVGFSHGLGILEALRAQGVSATLYPTAVKLKKSLNYADNLHIPFVIIIGEQERVAQQFILKNMESGEQLTYSQNQLNEVVSLLNN